MTFEEEWAELKAQAQQQSLQLNDASSSGKSGERLHVTPGLLQARADEAEKVARKFGHADDGALRETSEVAAGLHGFRSAAAFATFEERWKSQVRHVQGMLKRNLASGLRTAAAEFNASEDRRKSDFQGIGGNDK